MSPPWFGEWPPPITFVGRMRNCAAPGCASRKCRAVMIVRGITQPARRLFDGDDPDLARLLRSCHGADESRAPCGVCELVKTAARLLLRGAPMCEASWDFWPGKKALGRPAAVHHTAEPHAEPSDVLPDKVVALNSDLAPHDSIGDSGQSATYPPMSVEERTRGVADAPLSPVPGFPLCAMGLPADCVALVSKKVGPVPWRGVQFEIGRRPYDGR